MDTILHFVVGNALVATVLAILVAALACFCRRPALVHSLWLLVLLKCLTPPLVQVPLPWPAAAAPAPDQMTVLPPLPLPDLSELPVCPVARLEDKEARFTVEDPSLAVPAGEGTSFKPIVLAAWLTGSVLWCSLAGLRLSRLHRLLALTQPAPAEVQEQAQRLAALLGLRYCPVVWFLPGPVSPMLLALGLRPRLLVPAELWKKLSPDQRDTLLAHELAHLRRGDPWVRRLELLVLALYWWHPVVWIARRQLQEAEEQCCDAWVVWALPEAAPAYAQALLETVTFLSRSRTAVPLGASGAGQVPLLKRRLTMILDRPAPRRLSRLGFWGVVGLGLLVLPLLPGGAQTQPPAPGTPPALEKEFVAVEQNLGYYPPAKALVFRSNVCLQCHSDPHAWKSKVAPADDWKKSHDEVLRLMDEVKVHEKRLADAQARLKQALQRLNHASAAEKQGGWWLFSTNPKDGKKPAAAPPSEERLRELEKKLDQIRKEVDGLRKQLPKDNRDPASPGKGSQRDLEEIERLEWTERMRSKGYLGGGPAYPRKVVDGLDLNRLPVQEQEPFLQAAKQFNSGKYPEALALYQDLFKRYPKGPEGLSALSGCIRCSAALKDQAAVRQHVKAVQALLPTVDEELRNDWEKWLNTVNKQWEK
jgi:beta-lactamase regulating signal transducer with metallopeptidase domain